MSQPITVGVISQALRKQYCSAYFRSRAPGVGVILTGDPGAFEDQGLSEKIEVRPISAGLLGSRHLGQKARRRMLGWMRGGSPIGLRFEKLARRAMALIAAARDSGQPGQSGGSARQITHQGLIDDLTQISSRDEVELIVVFDIFDLPPVLDFAAGRGIPIEVR